MTLIIIAALTGLLGGAVIYLLSLRDQLRSEKGLRAEQSAEYARRDVENRKLAIAAIDRRLVLEGSVPLDESLSEPEKSADIEPETVEDIKRMLVEEEQGGIIGSGRINSRRELIRKLRDREEADSRPEPRTMPVQVPYDPTAGVERSN